MKTLATFGLLLLLFTSACAPSPTPIVVTIQKEVTVMTTTTPPPTSIPTPSLVPTSTHTPTPTRAPTFTPALYTISATVFFDYDGSGLQSEGEPSIEEVPVLLDDVERAITAPEGTYTVEVVAAGRHNLRLSVPRAIQDRLSLHQPIPRVG